MIFPSGASIEFEYSDIRNYYHVDVWFKNTEKGKATLMDELELRGRSQYGSEPPIPIILELDYNGEKILAWAVVRPRPHPELCVWLYDNEKGGSFGPDREGYGHFNEDVTQTPAEFAKQQISNLNALAKKDPGAASIHPANRIATIAGTGKLCIY